MSEYSRSCFKYPYKENWYNGTDRLLNLEGENATIIEATRSDNLYRYGINGPMTAESCIKDGGIDCSGNLFQDLNLIPERTRRHYNDKRRNTN